MITKNSMALLCARSVWPFICLTPFLMVLSRNIATPILTLIGLLSVWSALQLRGWTALRQALLSTFTSWPAILAGLVLVYMAAAAAWSPAGFRGAESVVHLAANIAVFAVAASAVSVLKGEIRTSAGFLAAAFGLAAILVIIELSFGSPVRGLFGGSAEPFRMNRAAVALALFLPIVVTLEAISPKPRFYLFLLVFLCGGAIFMSQSETARLAFLILLLAAPICFALGRKSIALIAVLVVFTLAFMPVISPFINGLIPASVHETVGYGSLGIRADIWTAYSSLIFNAPFLGHGVEASHVAGEAYRLTNNQNSLLGHGHPHNLAIQVWFELGGIGLLVFAVFLAVLFRSLHVLTMPAYIVPVAATAAAIWAVFIVSHGAWQAWWWSLIEVIALAWIIIQGAASVHSGEDVRAS